MNAEVRPPLEGTLTGVLAQDGERVPSNPGGPQESEPPTFEQPTVQPMPSTSAPSLMINLERTAQHDCRLRVGLLTSRGVQCSAGPEFPASDGPTPALRIAATAAACFCSISSAQATLPP